MTAFTIHTVETAPETSKPLLEKRLKATGSIPNLHGVMAEVPGLLQTYLTAHEQFMKTSFDAEELTVVWQTINVEHECHYCVPGHTMIANMMKVDPALTEALRNRSAMPTEKLQALQDMTLAMVRQRGRLSPEELETFFAAGYEKHHLLEIILGLSQKVISNYVNSIAETPLDPYLEKLAWK